MHYSYMYTQTFSYIYLRFTFRLVLKQMHKTFWAWEFLHRVRTQYVASATIYFVAHMNT